MADSDPLVRAVAPVAAPAVIGLGRGSLLAAAAWLFTSGLLAGQVAQPPAAAAPRLDPCALPAGYSLELLAPRERAVATRRALACADLAHRRIDAATYRAAIAALDPAWAEAAPPPPAPAMMWGATVRAVSSEYSSSNWSALRALGAPDVFPAAGDQVNAWASRGADDRVEYLEVGLAHAARLSAVEIYETFNPGAVSSVELVTASGTRHVVHPRQRAGTFRGAPAQVERIAFACTAEPIVAIAVTLDSPRVPGWNELDAIGGQPCDEATAAATE